MNDIEFVEISLDTLSLENKIFLEIIDLDSHEFERPWSLDGWKVCLKSPGNYKLFCVTKEKKLVAFNLFFLSPHEKLAHLLKIFVKIEHRNAGLAKYLLNNSIKSHLNSGLNKIFLEVEVENLPALGLYRNYGFKNLGVATNFYGVGLNAYRMIYEILVKP